MKKASIILVLIFSGLTSVFGQEGAGQAGEFLRWGAGGRAFGFGRAFTAIANDASALYWNPAGLSSLPRIGATFMFMHVPMRSGASHDYLAAAFPLRLLFVKSESDNPLVQGLQKLNIGGGFLWHSLGEFQFYMPDATPLSSEDTNIAETALYLSVSYPFNALVHKMLSSNSALEGDFDLGVTAKIVNQDLFGVKGTATSFDVGIKYTHFSNVLSFGLILRDINRPRFSFSETIHGDRIPASSTLGFSLNPPLGALRGLVLGFDYGIIAPGKRDREVMFGAEYDLSFVKSNLPLKVRLGTNSEHESLTIGLTLSPELSFDNDWLPSGDWTFANDRGAFDAIGPRYAISIDKNPFDAKYWYRNAEVQFAAYDCRNLQAILENEELPKYLHNAETAKNPGGRAYRYEAALRRADLAFMVALAETQSQEMTPRGSPAETGKKFTGVSEQYSKRAAKYLALDSGKDDLQHSEYIRSFYKYVQALLLSGESRKAVSVCADSGKSWGKHINVYENEERKVSSGQAETINLLYGYALMKSGQSGRAVRVLGSDFNRGALSKYFLAHLEFVSADYGKCLETLADTDLNDTDFPDDIFVPVTYDCSFGDEVLFLRGAALYRLANRNDELITCIAEFAKIPRFYPDSDLARFLMKGDHVLEQMVDAYDNGDVAQVRKLLEKIIESYLRSFETKALKETTYTYHYR